MGEKLTEILESMRMAQFRCWDCGKPSMGLIREPYIDLFCPFCGSIMYFPITTPNITEILGQ